jgi:hypothetical protein
MKSSVFIKSNKKAAFRRLPKAAKIRLGLPFKYFARFSGRKAALKRKQKQSFNLVRQLAAIGNIPLGPLALRRGLSSVLLLSGSNIQFKPLLFDDVIQVSDLSNKKRRAIIQAGAENTKNTFAFANAFKIPGSWLP